MGCVEPELCPAADLNQPRQKRNPFPRKSSDPDPRDNPSASEAAGENWSVLQWTRPGWEGSAPCPHRSQGPLGTPGHPSGLCPSAHCCHTADPFGLTGGGLGPLPEDGALLTADPSHLGAVGQLVAKGLHPGTELSGWEKMLALLRYEIPTGRHLGGS